MISSQPKKTKKNVILGICAFALAAALLFAIYWFNIPETNAGTKQYALTVVDDRGTATTYTAISDADYVGQALSELAQTQDFTIEGTQSKYGLFIERVNGLTADYLTDDAYWSFYLNGDYATTGIDRQPLTDGDEIELRYDQETR